MTLGLLTWIIIIVSFFTGVIVGVALTLTEPKKKEDNRTIYQKLDIEV